MRGDTVSSQQLGGNPGSDDSMGIKSHGAVDEGQGSIARRIEGKIDFLARIIFLVVSIFPLHVLDANLKSALQWLNFGSGLAGAAAVVVVGIVWMLILAKLNHSYDEICVEAQAPGSKGNPGVRLKD